MGRLFDFKIGIPATEGTTPEELNCLFVRPLQGSPKFYTNITEDQGYTSNDLNGRTVQFDSLGITTTIESIYYRQASNDPNNPFYTPVLHIVTPANFDMSSIPYNTPISITLPGTAGEYVINDDTPEIPATNTSVPFQWANINFGEYPAEIPLNTPLTVRVVAYCETQYNEQYIFNVEAHADIPSASHSISITWISGGGDEIDTSSMINNNDLGNTTIDGWESLETPGASDVSNGVVTLSQSNNHLRHTITKTEIGNYQQRVHLKIFANNANKDEGKHGK